MAVDEEILMDAAESGVATLRLYRWSEPTLSLGYFQRYEDRWQHAASRECAVVRRQTGGGAILHDRELTYSLTLPAAHPLARQSEMLYASVHDAFIRAIETTLADDAARWALLRHDRTSSAPRNEEPFLCFQRRARGDVLLAERANGADKPWKILGSAQRRHRGAILQHGSLLLERSPAAPELPGLFDLTGRSLDVEDFIAALTVPLERVCAERFLWSRSARELQPKATETANRKYSSADWTSRR